MSLPIVLVDRLACEERGIGVGVREGAKNNGMVALVAHCVGEP